MRFDVFTLLPGVFEPYLQESILGRAQAAGLIEIAVHNIRDYATDRHHITDDVPYGGGGGMIMKPEPIFAAVESVLGTPPRAPVILLTPQGRVFTQTVARELARHPRLALLCGRYEGLDERVRQHLATDEISIGDYVLTGGELPALAIVDAVARLIPGVLGARWAADDDSHASGLLEYPHYTRPASFRGWTVPDVLLSGHHAEIERWRHKQALERTLRRRPDMLAAADLSAADARFLEEIRTRGDSSQAAVSQEPDLVQQQFTTHAKSYVTSTTHSQGGSLTRIQALLPARSSWRVLDVATGGGHTALAFAPRVARVLATDLTAAMLRAAQEFVRGRGATNVDFCQAGAARLPVADASVDLVTCRIALHHFPDAGAAAREWARVLRPGGYVALADNVVPDDDATGTFMNDFERRRDPSHGRAHRQAELAGFLAAAGLAVTHQETFRKTLDFAEWTARTGTSPQTEAALQASLLATSGLTREALNPREENGRLVFDLIEAVLVAWNAPP